MCCSKRMCRARRCVGQVGARNCGVFSLVLSSAQVVGRTNTPSRLQQVGEIGRLARAIRSPVVKGQQI